MEPCPDTFLAIEDYYVMTDRPRVMPAAHWHGHVECNWFYRGTAEYAFEGHRMRVPQRRLVMFWAGIPHRLTALFPEGPEPVETLHLSVPLDVFLFMHRIGPLQNALLSGEVIALPEASCGIDTMLGWIDDFASGHPDRMECLRLEFNTMLRRALANDAITVRRPKGRPPRRGSARDMHHVVAMIRAISERLGQPIRTRDISAVTGLNSNYASNVFSRNMHISLKKFIIRMQLLKARTQLIATTKPAEQIAFESGFSSTSQFYHHFKALYGTTAGALRTSTFSAEVRP